MRQAPPPRGRIPGHLSRRERMDRKLLTKRGRRLYRQRSQIIEPVFGQTKSCRGIDRFHAAWAGELSGGMEGDLRDAQPAEVVAEREGPPERKGVRPGRTTIRCRKVARSWDANQAIEDRERSSSADTDVRATASVGEKMRGQPCFASRPANSLERFSSLCSCHHVHYSEGIKGVSRESSFRTWVAAMVAYSEDLRERVLAAVDAGEGTQEEIAERFRVSSRWIRKLLALRGPHRLDRPQAPRRRPQAPDPRGGGRGPGPPSRTTPMRPCEELRQATGFGGCLMTVWRAFGG